MANKYKWILTVLDQAKKAMSGHVEALVPDTEAIDAVLDGMSDHLKELIAANKDRKKEAEAESMMRGGPNDR